MRVMFTVQKAKKGIKRRFISIVGVQLWNNVKMDVRMVNLFCVFKRFIYKNNLRVISVIETYVYGRCVYIYIFFFFFIIFLYFI